MTAGQKFKEEKEEALNARKERIFSSAFELFSKEGIDTIAINDIARNAEIGVASLYRYYTTKDQIAIQTAVWVWQKELETFLPLVSGPDYDSLNGIDQLKKIFDGFLYLYENEKKFLSFVYFFDSYAVRQSISKEDLSEYESTIKQIQVIVSKAIDKGLQDKTIVCPQGIESNQLYFTVMHALFSMVQKLSLSNSLLKMNDDVTAVKQVQLLSTLLINSLKG